MNQTSGEPFAAPRPSASTAPALVSPAGTLAREVGVARRYFSSFADDYHRAFCGQGRRPLHRLLNVLFRRATFESRMQVVRGFLQTHGVAAKYVLDLGCGSGEVSLLAAQLGAHVTGLDVVEEMVAIAREGACRAGLADVVRFQVADVLHAPLEPTDVVLLVSVLEYYSAIDEFLTRVCGATRGLLVIVDTRGPLWRRLLRHTLARLKGFRIYYRQPRDFARPIEAAGFREVGRVRGHSFWALAYEPAAK
jgi:SAM-dependent methyltransferase